MSDCSGIAQHLRELAKARRETNAALGMCINGASHGPPEQGRPRCAWCCTVHKLGLRAALQLAKRGGLQPPPGHVLRLRTGLYARRDG